MWQKEERNWPESVTTTLCLMHGLNGWCWEDNVIKTENISSNTMKSEYFRIYYVNRLLLSKVCIYFPLSKSGVTCLHMQPEVAPWEVIPWSPSLLLGTNALKSKHTAKIHKMHVQANVRITDKFSGLWQEQKVLWPKLMITSSLIE